ERGETHRLEVLRAAVPAGVRFSYVQQDRPLGLGHAVACARALVGEEPFAVLLPDELLRGDPPCLAAMATAWRRAGGNCVAALEVPAADVSRYGVIAPAGPANDDGLIPLAGMVEKPAPEDAPSNLMLPGRYILQPRLFHHLAAGRRGAGGEIQLTDAMAALLAEQPVFAYRFDGQRFDCGGKAGFLAANLALALERPELAAEVRQLLAGLTPAADA
ncbi:MAG: sugar phosphate nucleotidyltransferase, partial [Alphaproteobacteria bacterium]